MADLGNVYTPRWNRRQMMTAGIGAAGLAAGWGLFKAFVEPRAPVFLAGNQTYSANLARTIREGLRAVDIDPAIYRGKRVLLKPNLVEPTRLAPHMTTHPSIVAAVAEVFRAAGALVCVGEAPGHLRDTEQALTASGVGAACREERLPFADLNYEAVGWRANLSRFSKLKGLYFPQSILEADLIVSLPKLKTHHWVGITCSMKNLYGTLPGIKYGWPKNVLHFNGIPETVADINAALPNTIAIVDAIDCMEGDGPILGSCKHLGMIAISPSRAAVDATCARIMGLDPHKIPYLRLVGGRWAPIAERSIEQRGEAWQKLASPFQLIDWPHIQQLKSRPVGPLVS